MSCVLEVGITSPISVLDVSLAFTGFLWESGGGKTSASLTVQPDMVQGM